MQHNPKSLLRIIILTAASSILFSCIRVMAAMQDGSSPVVQHSRREVRAKVSYKKQTSIGTATMTKAGVIILDLRAETADGAGESRLTYTPANKQYNSILKHLGGLRPGQSKSVPPWEEEPHRLPESLKHSARDMKTTAKSVKVHLDIIVEEGKANATLTFTNVSSKEAYLNRVNGCLENIVQNNVFVIRTGDQKVSYLLPLVKRRDKGEHDAVKIVPGQTITTHLNLSAAYAFLPGRHSYTATYEGMHYDPHHDILLDLASNQVSFVLDTK